MQLWNLCERMVEADVKGESVAVMDYEYLQHLFLIRTTSPHTNIHLFSIYYDKKWHIQLFLIGGYTYDVEVYNQTEY